MGRLVDSIRSIWLEERPSKDPALARYFGYAPSASGISVSEWTALNYSAYWAGVRRISSDVAALPLELYRRVGDSGRAKYRDHPLYWLLHNEFSPLHTSFIARQTIQAHALTWGNGYGWIERNGAGRPVAIWPLTPNRVTPELLSLERLVYRIKQLDGVDITLAAEDVLHIPGLGFDGIQGYSVIAKARESLGLGLAGERFGAKFFGSGATAGLIASHPGKLSDKAHANLKASLQREVSGLENAHSLVLLEEGIKVEKISIPPNDAQFLETRQFQVIEICRWLGVPPHKLYDLERATFSNIEHQAIEYLQDTLVPWLSVWEAELERKLIAGLEQGIQFIEFNVDGYLRGDQASRYAAHALAIQWGWKSRDEVRETENLNPIPGGLGKVYLIPANMIDAEALPDEPAPVTPAATQQPKQPVSNGNGTQPARTAEIIAAQRDLFVEQAGRMVRQETQALRRASRRGLAGVHAWAESFYPKFAQQFAAAIEPAIRTHRAHIGHEGDAVPDAMALVAAHIDDSRTQLLQLAVGTRGELENAVEALAERWERERPKHLADALMTEEIENAIADA